MICCCRNKLPKNSEKVINAGAIGFTFINGFGWAYDDGYQSEFEGKLKRDEHYQLIHEINDTVFDKMPCPTITIIMYLLALPTLGLSFLIMYFCCIMESEKKVKQTIRAFNMGLYPYEYRAKL